MSVTWDEVINPYNISINERSFIVRRTPRCGHLATLIDEETGQRMRVIIDEWKMEQDCGLSPMDIEIKCHAANQKDYSVTSTRLYDKAVEAMRLYSGNKVPYVPYGMTAKKVIYNPPATIVLWKDGTKTVVKCDERDNYDPKYGLALCYMKKALGNTSRNLNDVLSREKHDE